LCEVFLLEDRLHLDTLEAIQLRTLSEDYEALYECKKHSDIVLIIGDEREELKAHKLVLAARSPVFAAMFEHECEESRRNRIEIVDLTVDVMEQMLRYIYTGKVSSEQCLFDLLVAADKVCS